MRSYWVDILCFSSAVKIILDADEGVDSIYYLNVTVFFKPFTRLFAILIKRSVVHVLDVVEAEERIGNTSLFELIHARVNEYVCALVDYESVNENFQRFDISDGMSLRKYEEFIKENAYYYFYRVSQLEVLIEKRGDLNSDIIVLMQTPFSGVVREICRSGNIVSYFFFWPLMKLVETREGYLYDRIIHPGFRGNYELFVRYLYKWLAMCVNSFLFSGKSIEKEGVNIGVELIQSRIRRNDVSDMYWLDGVSEKESVCAIAYVQYDKETLDYLDMVGVRPVKIMGDKFELDASNSGQYDIVTAKPKFMFSSMSYVSGLRACLSRDQLANWFCLNNFIFKVRVEYLRQVYARLGIRLLWSMYDSDDQKLIKAQSIELVDGLFIGSHWSAYPNFMLKSQKCYDVLFAWGDHFVDNHFVSYPHLSVYKVGYPSDHYFDFYRGRSDDLRMRYDGKYIISFVDNIFGNDIYYSVNMHLDIYKMLIRLMDDKEDIVVLIKPKRKFFFNKILSELPEINEYIDQGRIEVFYGETDRSKYVPAIIGMASDLVIGLGISTAAAESCFAGAVSFHVDLTGFYLNDFANKGADKVVFRSMSKLEDAVKLQIDGGWLTIRECKKYHQSLDPFQDGKCWYRTGSVVEELRSALLDGHGREEAAAIAYSKCSFDI